MYQEIAYAGFLAATYAYHRWIEPHLPPPPPPQVRFPTTEEGTTCPITFGRTLVDAPVMVWAGRTRTRENPGGLDGQQYWGSAPYVYDIEALFNICIPFQGGQNQVHSIYIGDVRIPDGPTNIDLPGVPNKYLFQLTGDGGFEMDSKQCLVQFLNHTGPEPQPANFAIGGQVEYLNGKESQLLANPTTGAPLTAVATRMIARGITGQFIPGYRGRMSIFLGTKLAKVGSTEVGMWCIGPTPQWPAFRFEVSTYPNVTYLPYIFSYTVGADANPADVLMSIICDRYGKLGRNVAEVIDDLSFRHAHSVLAAEGHGYSRSFPERTPAKEMVDDVLRQIDATLYSNQDTGRWHVKLIRPDFSVPDLMSINPTNCVSCDGFAAGGWTGTNKVVVKFPDRALGYQDNTATAQNLATAVGSDGEEREVVIDMRGVSGMPLAEKLAARELAARSGPISKVRVVVGREFYRLNPGDPVLWTWPDYNISNKVMRIASKSFGTATDNHIVFELIEDYFYTYRGIVTAGGGAPAFPGPGGGWTTLG